jgi:hypothetical protein
LRDIYSWLESHSGFTPITASIPSFSTTNTTKINN